MPEAVPSAHDVEEHAPTAISLGNDERDAETAGGGDTGTAAPTAPTPKAGS
jgi:hypothetical protein